MEPWMGALMDNLEVLTQSQEGGSWGRAATNDLLRNRIKIRSLNFMRGRTFLNRYLILDEAQNLTPKQMKALVTRAGPGTKLVCLGNIAQIDTPYLTETTSGLTYVVNRFRGWQHCRPHHAGARRTLAARGLRVGSALRPRSGRTMRGPAAVEPGITARQSADARAAAACPAAVTLAAGSGAAPRPQTTGSEAARHRHAGAADAVPRRRVQDRPHDRAAAARRRPDHRGPGGQRVPPVARHAAREPGARGRAPLQRSSRSATRRSTRSRCRAASSASMRVCCSRPRTKASSPACSRTKSRTSRSGTSRAAIQAQSRASLARRPRCWRRS